MITNTALPRYGHVFPRRQTGVEARLRGITKSLEKWRHSNTDFESSCYRNRCIHGDDLDPLSWQWGAAVIFCLCGGH
jgi:hypothetical protein